MCHFLAALSLVPERIGASPAHSGDTRTGISLLSSDSASSAPICHAQECSPPDTHPLPGTRYSMVWVHMWFSDLQCSTQALWCYKDAPHLASPVDQESTHKADSGRSLVKGRAFRHVELCCHTSSTRVVRLSRWCLPPPSRHSKSVERSTSELTKQLAAEQGWFMHAAAP